MAKAYRHPYNRRLQPDRLTRPPIPAWLDKWKNLPDNKQSVSARYWLKIYLATPPWLNDSQIAEMKRKVKECPPGCHVDHEVPLKSKLVCGLNVPWNLAWVPERENLLKSNKYWPGMAMQPMDLFDDHKYEPFTLLPSPNRP